MASIAANRRVWNRISEWYQAEHDPDLVVPEAARVLRPGGRLVFNTGSPWSGVCYDDDADKITTRLHHDYFTLGPQDEGEGATSYLLTYGDWIRTLRGAGLVIDDLIEPRPAPGQRNGYMEMDPPDWAHRWPLETLWVTHKA